MDNKLYRYGSFALFPPDSEIYPTHLTEAGFYYEGNGDEVVCFKCGLKHRGWKKGDIPMQIHKARSPNCPFVTQTVIPTSQPEQTVSRTDISNQTSENRGLLISSPERSNDNTPGACGGPSDISFRRQRNDPTNLSHVVEQTTIGESVLCPMSENRVASSPKDGNVCRERPQKLNTKSNSSRQPNDHTSKRQSDQRPQARDNISEENNQVQKSLILEPLGVSMERPVYPQYAITTVRLSSFRNWPKQMTQKPQDLAKAGFFHEGVADRVRCFFCGGGLVNWDPEDEPWIEHARWYPRCIYLRQSKGDDFIYKVQGGNEDESKPQNLTNPLSHPASISVLDMGCKPDLVSRAWKSLLTDNGQENITAEKLLVKVWQLEEEEINKQSHRDDDQCISEVTNENSHKDEQITTSKEKNKDIDLAERVAIAEENRQLREQQTCKICLDEDVAIVFLPCGHLAACASCAPALRKCPICRTFIKGTVRAIIS